MQIWTSTLQRTQQTGFHLPFEKKTWKSLDELDAGVCDGMTYEEIEVSCLARFHRWLASNAHSQERYPEDYESRDEDKFNYRYRGGESYRDVVVRLEPVIMELERQENILIIAHQAILRCLYAYFQALPQEELPYIKVSHSPFAPCRSNTERRLATDTFTHLDQDHAHGIWMSRRAIPLAYCSSRHPPT